MSKKRRNTSDHYHGVPIKRKRDKGVKPQKFHRPNPEFTQQMVERHIWYALRVAPQKEFLTQTILHERGMLTYVPSDNKWRKKDRYRNTKVLIPYPVARGYVFAAFPVLIDGAGREVCRPLWFDLFNISTVLGVVGVRGEPKPIDRVKLGKIIVKFKNGLKRPKREAYMWTGKEFDVGDTVLVASGPFQGHSVMVLDIDVPKPSQAKTARATIRLELFGSEQDVEIDCLDLIAA